MPARFNGGPSNCPAKPRPLARLVHLGPAGFNGGPSNCPAKPTHETAAERTASWASMEGRAIARPNRRPRRSPHRRAVASMEGRAIARPNAAMGSPLTRIHPLQWRAEQLPGQPDPTGVVEQSDDGFNGGPSNCPAKPASCRYPSQQAPASMEGRAIARPNRKQPRGEPLNRHKLQWRAEQLPGQTSGSPITARIIHRLQWRAEQLPGQTSGKPRREQRPPLSFNGVPSNCPAKRQRHFVGDRERCASMEGRAIARPNSGVMVDLVGSNNASMEGRAIARPNHHRHGPSLTDRPASMEGRAIARPNLALLNTGEAGADASMEGRAIARPNI